jgi:hypothetical protein
MRTADSPEQDLVVGAVGASPPAKIIPPTGHVTSVAENDVLNELAMFIGRLQRHVIAGHLGKLMPGERRSLSEDLARLAALCGGESP